MKTAEPRLSDSHSASHGLRAGRDDGAPGRSPLRRLPCAGAMYVMQGQRARKPRSTPRMHKLCRSGSRQGYGRTVVWVCVWVLVFLFCGAMVVFNAISGCRHMDEALRGRPNASVSARAPVSSAAPSRTAAGFPAAPGVPRESLAESPTHVLSETERLERQTEHLMRELRDNAGETNGLTPSAEEIERMQSEGRLIY